MLEVTGGARTAAPGPEEPSSEECASLQRGAGGLYLDIGPAQIASAANSLLGFGSALLFLGGQGSRRCRG
jgi:hypothetical protein